MLTFHNKTFHNWKEYIEDKFSDKLHFNVEQFDEDFKDIFSYRITSTDRNCNTEIIVQLFVENNFSRVYDIHFNHPNSPILSAENKENNYGWDGIGDSFTLKYLVEADEWINIPLFQGWTERTFYFDEVEIKTEAEWYKQKNETIPLKQNYLDRYGCLTFPIVPIVIWYKSWYWKTHPDRLKIIEKKVPAMFVTSVEVSQELNSESS